MYIFFHFQKSVWTDLGAPLPVTILFTIWKKTTVNSNALYAYFSGIGSSPSQSTVFSSILLLFTWIWPVFSMKKMRSKHTTCNKHLVIQGVTWSELNTIQHGGVTTLTTGKQQAITCLTEHDNTSLSTELINQYVTLLYEFSRMLNFPHKVAKVNFSNNT